MAEGFSGFTMHWLWVRMGRRKVWESSWVVKTVERSSERKWAVFIPTGGAVERFLRKTKRSRVKKTGLLETAPGR